jgi:hypothetical protein
MKLDTSGNYEQTPGNIAEMFQYLAVNQEVLEDRQREYVASVKGQYEARGTMSEKQFRWICRYFDMVHRDIEDWEHDQGDDSHPGHPSNFGDN